MRCHCAIVALMLAWLFPTGSRAADPVMTISLKSYDELVSDSKHLANLFNAPGIASLPQVVDQMTRGQGLKGFDTTKRLGVCITSINVDEPGSIVFFVPVTDSGQFEQTLETLFSKPQRDGELPKYDFGNNGLFAKQVGSYFFFSEAAAALKEPPDPVRQAKTSDDLALEINVPGLVEQFRADIEAFLAEQDREQQRILNDPLRSDAEKKTDQQGHEFVKSLVRSFLDGSDGAFVGVNIDSKAKTISLEAGHRAKPNSDFSAMINEWTKIESPFSGLVSPTTVGSLLISAPINKAFQDGLLASVEPMEAEFLKNMERRPDLSDEKRKAMQRQMRQFTEAIRKIVSSGRYDFAIVVDADKPDDLQATLAFKVVDGATFGKLIDDRIKLDLTEEDEKRIAWNVASINGAAVHRAELPAFDDLFKGPLHWGAINDTAYIVVGRDSLQRLKSAVAAKPVKSDAPVSIQLDIVRIVSLFGNHFGPEFAEYSKQLTNQGPGRISMRFVTRPNEFRLQWVINDSVVELARRSFGELIDQFTANRDWPLPRRVIDDDRDVPAVSWRPKPGTRLKYRVRLGDATSTNPESKREIDATLVVTFGTEHDDALPMLFELEQYAAKSTSGADSMNIDTKLNSAKQSGKAGSIKVDDLLASAKRACREPRFLKIGKDGLVMSEFARPASQQTNADRAVETDVLLMLRAVFVPVDRKEIAPYGSWTTTETVGGIPIAVTSSLEEVEEMTSEIVEISTFGIGAVEQPGQEWSETTLTVEGNYEFQATAGYLVKRNHSEKFFTLKDRQSSERVHSAVVELIKAEEASSPDAKFAKLTSPVAIKVLSRSKGDQTGSRLHSGLGGLLAPKDKFSDPNHTRREQTPSTNRSNELPDIPDAPIRPSTSRGSKSGASTMRPSERGRDARASSKIGSRSTIPSAEPRKSLGAPRAELSPTPPAGYLKLRERTKLVPGTPLKLREDGEWVAVTVVDVNPTRSVVVVRDDAPQNKLTCQESQLAIRVTVQHDLERGDAQKKFAANLDRLTRNVADSPSSVKTPATQNRAAKRTARSYPSENAIPNQFERVDEATLIPKGTKMKVAWGTRWLSVTALDESSEGPIFIRWDEYGTSWDEAVHRDSIVIDKSAQAKLKKTKSEKP